jgi:rare lipoprotein A
MKRLSLLGLVGAVASACVRPAPAGAPPAAPYPAMPYAAPSAPWPAPVLPVATSEPAAAGQHGGQHAAEAGIAVAPFQQGKATYYHDSLAGNRTASGEIYHPAAPTAAHRNLPFGTVVDVVRTDGRWVRVRINDRGPFVHGRIIDLSRHAAALVGLDRAGVAEVSVYVVRRP